MIALDKIKHQLIDKILPCRIERLLEAIDSIFVSSQTEELIPLSSEQIEMLMMSEQDIENGHLVADSDKLYD